jgi:D-amino-acid oxidase
MPVVVNCTGIGARDLTDDTDLHPVRGQVVRAEPGITARFFGAEEAPGGLAYIIPHADCTVLGGTDDTDAWDLTPDPRVAEAILARCAVLEPAVARARVLGHAAGLRPVRSAVRLEAERRADGVVVHHYGHGGSGVTFSWGCAEDAARLVETAMREGA